MQEIIKAAPTKQKDGMKEAYMDIESEQGCIVSLFKNGFQYKLYCTKSNIIDASNGLQRLQNVLTNTHPVCYNKDRGKAE